MIKLNLDSLIKIGENENLFKSTYKDETFFILGDVKTENIFQRSRKSSDKQCKISVEKNVEVNNFIFENAAIICFSGMSEKELEFIEDILSSIYFNKENLLRDIGEIFEFIFSFSTHIFEYDRNQVIGMFGEVLTLIKLREFFPNIAKNLLGDEKARFDISIDEEKKVEVKTTELNRREHTFNIEQLRGREEIAISSVILDKDESGINLEQLLKENKEFILEIPLIKRMQLLNYMNSNAPKIDIKINLKKTIENIRFFNSKMILKTNLKDGEKNKSIKRFTVLLNDDQCINNLGDYFKIKNKDVDLNEKI